MSEPHEDREVAAMRAVAVALESLPTPEEQHRVIRWAWDRYVSAPNMKRLRESGAPVNPESAKPLP
jgi:hypothetical protein